MPHPKYKAIAAAIHEALPDLEQLEDMVADSISGATPAEVIGYIMPDLLEHAVDAAIDALGGIE